MKNLIMYKPGEQSMVLWIKKRIKNNLNFISITTGETGAGKSYAMLSLAEQIDSEFSVNEQVAFNFKDLMTIINKFNNPEHPLNKKEFKVCLFDEVQTGINRRTWQNKVNMLFNFLLSTFRHQNIILLMTTPYSDYIDSGSMKLVHVVFEIRGWDKKTNKVHIRPKIMQYNDKLKKFYTHSLFVMRDKRTNKLVNWFLNKPSTNLIIPYEQMKTAFTTKLNDMITHELSKLDNNANGTADKRKELNPDSVQPLIWDIVTKEGYSTQEQLAQRLTELRGKQMNLGQLNINITSMRRKGYDIREFKHTNEVNTLVKA